MMLVQVAQYASSNGQGKTASDAVDECLRYMMFFFLFKSTMDNELGAYPV